MVHKAYGQIASDGVVRLFQSHRPDYRDGEQVRDFVYVADAVAATLYFWDHPRYPDCTTAAPERRGAGSI